MKDQEIIKLFKDENKISDEVLGRITDLVQLRKLFRKEVMTNKKAICVCCNKKTTKYTRSLNKGMYFFLMHLSSKWHKGEWVYYDTVKKEAAGKFQSNATDYSKLSIFGLIELKKDKDDDTGITSGQCRITDFGWSFLRGKATISKHYYIINNVIVDKSKENVFFDECQKKFRMKDLSDD